ncbi:MAG: hypothetical protein ACPGYV_02920 [Phycisphaeraceae bacterium]
MIHVAILKPGYIREVLDGVKTIESRLTKTMQPPHGQIAAGERLFLKASGGPFMATAVAGRIDAFRDMKPMDVERLRETFGEAIGGDDAYWSMKRESRFATLVELREVEPLSVGPTYKVAYMKAWYVLDEWRSPVRDWTITPGALRNRYACLPGSGKRKAMTSRAIALELPSGETVSTEVARGRMLRWRGWGAVYEAAGARAGDTLRYVALGGGRYAVRLVRR